MLSKVKWPWAKKQRPIDKLISRLDYELNSNYYNTFVLRKVRRWAVQYKNEK